MRTSSTVRLLALTLLLALGACSSRTEIVVGIATDLTTPTAMDALRMRVSDGDGHLVVERQWPLGPGSRFHLPGSFGVGVHSSGPFIVHVDGLQKGAVVVSRHARLEFVDGHTLFIRLALVQHCYSFLDGSCPADRWCSEGVCRPIQVSAPGLPDYQSGDELRAQCGDGPALGLAPAPAMMCPAGLECSEAVCLRSASLDGPAPRMPDVPDMLSDLGGTPLDLLDTSDLTAPPTVDGGSEAGSLDATAPPDLNLDSAVIVPLDATGMALADSSGSVVDSTFADLTATVMPDLTVPPPAPDLTIKPDLVSTADLVAPPDLAPPPPPAFSWVSPFPQGTRMRGAFYDASSANQTGSPLWLVSDGGDALHLDAGGALVLEKTGSDASLFGVYAHGGEVWAVGAGPFVMHRSADGTWRKLAIPGGKPTRLIHLTGDGGSGVIALASDGSLVRADSSKAFQRDALPPVSSPAALWGGLDQNGQPCMLVAGVGVARYSAVTDTWTPDSSISPNINWTSVVGCGADGTVLVGGNPSTSPKAYLRRNGGWADISPTGYPNNETLDQLVVISPSDVYAWGHVYGQSGTGPLHFDGSRWSAIADTGLDYSQGSNVVMTGGPDGKGGTYLGALGGATLLGAQLYQYNPNNQTWRSSGSTPAHIDGKIWGDGKNLLVAPAGQHLNVPVASIYYTTTADDTTTPWKSSPINGGGKTLTQISQVFGIATGGGAYKYYAAADQGVLLSATDLAAGFSVEYDDTNGDQLGGVWAADTNNVYAIGTLPGNSRCRIYGKVNGAAWTSVFAEGAGNNHCGYGAIFGLSASEVYVGGGDNNFPTGDVVVYRGSGTTWTNKLVGGVRSGGQISDIWGANSNDIWAVGDNQGYLVYHQSGGTGFVPFAFPNGGSSAGSLSAISGTAANDVWTVGATAFHWDGTSWHPQSTPANLLIGVEVDAKHVWAGGYDNVLLLRR